MKTIVICSMLAALALCACEANPPTRPWRPEDHAGYRPLEQNSPQAADPAVPSAAPQAPVDPGVAVAAAFRIQCAGCHGPVGLGDGPAKPPGAQMPSFADAAWQASRTDEDLATSIVRGRGMMPAFGSQLPAETIARLVVHVRGLRAQP